MLIELGINENENKRENVWKKDEKIEGKSWRLSVCFFACEWRRKLKREVANEENVSISP